MAMTDPSFTHAGAVTPSDTVNFASPAYADGIWVGGVGNVTLVTRGGETVLLTAVPAGTYLPIGCTRVDATGTTATLMIRFWRE